MPSSRLLYSTAEDYLSNATQELREQVPDARFTTLGPDLGAVEADGLAIGDLATMCRETPTIFIRHLMREIATIPASEMNDLDTVVDQTLEAWLALPLRPAVSLQLWTSGEVHLPYRTDELRSALAEALTEEGHTVARSGQEQVLGLAITAEGASVGLTGTANTLSDWPGGRVRLAKPKGQLSRSEFKLEEVLREQHAVLPAGGGVAIDFGASPGGWTRVLRNHGFTVWAVDPAPLDPRLAGDRGVRHVRTTAGPFLAETDVLADVVVNDMRMDPDLSASIMLQAATRLRGGGLLIQTLKVTPHQTLATVRRVLASLSRTYEITWTGQLTHNRNEVTVVGRKR